MSHPRRKTLWKIVPDKIYKRDVFLFYCTKREMEQYMAKHYPNIATEWNVGGKHLVFIHNGGEYSFIFLLREKNTQFPLHCLMHELLHHVIYVLSSIQIPLQHAEEAYTYYLEYLVKTITELHPQLFFVKKK